MVMTSEVYYTLQGEGYMMMENMEGDWMARPAPRVLSVSTLFFQDEPGPCSGH